MPYWGTDSYKVVIKNILYLSLSVYSVYNAHKSKADLVVLEVLHFTISVLKSTRHFGLRFAYDTPKIWNDLLDDLHLATSLHSSREKFKTYLFAKAYPC